MPATCFRCGNGNIVPFKDCLAGCDHRCMSLPALTAAAQATRHWFGKPSVTQLIKPTRQTYLEITNDFSISPMGGIAAMIGTNSHKAFEEAQPNGWLAEVRLEDDITSGQFDAYDCKTQTLWDWKFFNVGKIARCLGMMPRWQKRVITRGQHKGEEKWEQVWVSGGVRDVMEIAIQLNYYRYLMEKHGIHVKNINVNMFVRSSVNAESRRMGITQPSYIVPVNFISLKWVRCYMKAKYDMLMKALKSGECPPPCSKKDRWSSSKTYPNRRCADWCDVNEFCDFYKTHQCGNHNRGMPSE